MDYRHTAIDTLTDYAQEFSGDVEGVERMSFGDILYSFLRNSSTGLNLPTEELKKIREISDEDWYSKIEKAYKYEREE